MAKGVEMKPTPREGTNMLGGLVPTEIYWEFKRAASVRKESMATAIMHAALLYIDAEKKEQCNGEAKKHG